MPRGSKSKSTSKQKRQAPYAEEGAKRRKRAAIVGLAMVAKRIKGGKKRSRTRKAKR
jgi:hypothetical protein